MRACNIPGSLDGPLPKTLAESLRMPTSRGSGFCYCLAYCSYVAFWCLCDEDSVVLGSASGTGSARTLLPI